jgi:hypothetical protein
VVGDARPEQRHLGAVEDERVEIPVDLLAGVPDLDDEPRILLTGELREARLVVLQGRDDVVPGHRPRLVEGHEADRPVGVLAVGFPGGHEVLQREAVVVVRPAPERPIPLVPPLVPDRRVERPAEPLREQLERVIEPRMVTVDEDVHAATATRAPRWAFHCGPTVATSNSSIARARMKADHSDGS